MLSSRAANLDFYDSPLDADHGGLGPVVRAQLGEDVLDPPLHGLLGDRKLVGDLFVGIAGGNQPQHTDFSLRQSVGGCMLGKFIGSFGGKSLSPGMNGTDCVDQFLMECILEKVTVSPSFQSAENLHIP